MPTPARFVAVRVVRFGLALLVWGCVSCAPVTPLPAATPTRASLAATSIPTPPAVPSATPQGVTQSMDAPPGVVEVPDAPTSSPEVAMASAGSASVSPAVIAAYTVQSGDTLLGIAMQFGVPMAAIQLQNELGASVTVRVGQVLEIPSTEAWTGASPFWVLHVVAEGDTLSGLAVAYGLELSALLAANASMDPDMISIGQAIILPVETPALLLAAANMQASEEPVAAPVVTEEPAPAPASPETLPEVTEPAMSTPETAVAVPPTEETAPTEPETAPEAPPTSLPVPPAAAEVPPDVAALPGEIYRLLNEQRAAYNLPPLAWNETLARAAQRHANDCFARGWCSHTGSDGSHYKDRVIREGYDPVRWSECWAWYGSPDLAVAMWMDETPPNDPHRRTILNPDLTEVGVGVVPGNGFGYYFIADFGKPR